MNKVRTILLVPQLFICSWCWSQTCVENILPTTNMKIYSVNNNGTITDTRHRIMWAQCSVGQQWHNKKCAGDASKLNWSEAKQAADTAIIANFSDWRLPTVYELNRITELRCHQPAINLMLFPTTPAIDFWSATEFVNNTDMAWLVHFAYGENHSGKKANLAAIRLVRSITNNGK